MDGVWVVLVSLLFCNYAYALRDMSRPNINNITLSLVNNTSTTNTSLTADPGKSVLAQVGRAVGSVFKGIVKGVEYVAKGIGFVLQSILTGSAVVWRYLMIAGVHIFHSDHKALIVVYRLHYGI